MIEIEKHFLREQFFDNLKDSSKIILQMTELDLDKKELSYLAEYGYSVYDLILYWERSGYISDRDKNEIFTIRR